MESDPDITDIPQPETPTDRHEQAAYRYGLAYQRPALSQQANITDGYACDVKPQDFDNQCLVRATTPAVHADTISCSLSEDYADNNVFNDTNIILEILQNAEPKDSKGTWFGVEFYADGKWRPAIEEIAEFQDEQIEAVRIVDNGRGYLPRNMTVLGAGKREDKESAGRFGSGMKVSDRSALGRGVKIIRYSRNWRAKPYLKSELIDTGYRQTVSYNVEFFDQCFHGSIIEYRQVTEEMIAALRRIEDIYLPLDRTFRQRLLAHTPSGLILSPKSGSGEIMVHGRIYTPTVRPKTPLLFSYDLHDCTIDDPNRHYVDISKAEVNIREIWTHPTDKELFKKLLSSASQQKYYEHEMDGLETVPEQFIEAATEQYEIQDLKKSYIASDSTTEKEEKILNRRGYKKIKVPKSKFISETLKQAGLQSGHGILESVTSQALSDTIIANCQEETFSSCVCKAIACIDHFQDQEKTVEVVMLDPETQTETAIPLSQFFSESKDGQSLVSVRFIAKFARGAYLNTDRRGWYAQFDAFLTSCAATGTNAYIYNGTCELDSDRGSGRSTWAIVNTRNWENFPPSPLTIIIDIDNQSQANELKKLNKHSLNVDPNYSPIERTPYGDIVRLSEGVIYEYGIKTKKESTPPNTFSYNVQEKVTEENVGNKIRQIAGAATNPDVAKAILTIAKERGPTVEIAEYGAQIPDGNREIWNKAFVEVFGMEAVVSDLQNERDKMQAATIQTLSGIKTVQVHPKLTGTLVQCGVKKLSHAVQTTKVIEHEPIPVQEALLQVEQIIDKAIQQTLPQGRQLLKPQLKVARSVTNCYGQDINAGNGYLNPFLTDNTIYVFDSVVHPKKIDQLIQFIFDKKTEVYRNQMSEEEYLSFRTNAMSAASRAVDTTFLNRFKRMMFANKDKITKLIERSLKVVDISREAEENFPDLTQTPFKGLLQAEKAGQAKKAVVGKRQGKSPRRPWKRPGAKKLAVIAACLATTGIGLKVLRDNKDTEIGRNIRGTLERALLAMSSKLPLPEGSEQWLRKFIEPLIGGHSYIPMNIHIGVDMENMANKEHAQNQRTHFISDPKLEWGDFMSEETMTIYNGTGWQVDNNMPTFETPNYSRLERISHAQILEGGEDEVHLRTKAGGYIDFSSIKLLKSDGRESVAFIANKNNNGSYDIKILDEDIAVIIYHTVSPIKWEQNAEELTDTDYAQLPPEPYAYHTRVPKLDLTKIRFSSPDYPSIKNLRDLMDYLQGKSPYYKIQLIRYLVSKMRYTRTERTERAFKKFHSGELPEKDFLEFVLNSDELENPGEGDCDVQNTVFAMLLRFAGIPARLDLVFTKDGIAHAPASIFLPNIGWVLMDTMGERSIEEGVNQNAAEIDDQSNTPERTAQEANRKLLEILRKKQEYEQLGCPELVQ
jgi:hypothetical protein